MHDREITQARAHIFSAINEPSCDDDSRALLQRAAKTLTRLRDLPDGMTSGVSYSLAEPLLDRCATLLDLVASSQACDPQIYRHLSDAKKIVFRLFQFREV